MKKLGITLLIFFITSVSDAGLLGEKEQEFKTQKFEVTMEIVYNEITLEQAAKLESFAKDLFSDSCKVEIKKLKPVNSTSDFFVTTVTAASSFWEVGG